MVLSGAGISAESGLKTFRDEGGLWEEYKIEEIATPEAWQNNPSLVLEFYNKRRKEAMDARPNGAHIELAQQAEIYCIAPATADFIAKLAHGSADDLLSTLALCCTCPVLIAPALNAAMWEKSVVQRNIQQLKEDGIHCIPPQEGWLSCRQVGTGRMVEAETLFDEIKQRLGP